MGTIFIPTHPGSHHSAGKGMVSPSDDASLKLWPPMNVTKNSYGVYPGLTEDLMLTTDFIRGFPDLNLMSDWHADGITPRSDGQH